MQGGGSAGCVHMCECERQCVSKKLNSRLVVGVWSGRGLSFSASQGCWVDLSRVVEI